MQSESFDLKKGIENLLGVKITRNHSFPYFKVHKNKFLRLVLDFTDRCNLRCKMCFFNFPEKRNPIHDMDFNIFKKIADQLFPITSDLTLSCMAEPLLYKRFPDILDEVKNHYFVHSEYVTNGMLLDDIIMEKSVEAAIKTVQISFDGAKMETVEKIRKGADYKKIIEKILLFNKIKSNHKSKYPILRFNYVIMNDNINEVVDVISLAKEIGIDEINFRHIVPLKGLGVKLQSLIYSKQLASEYLLQAKEKAQSLKIKLIGFPLHVLDEVENEKFLETIDENKCFLPWEQVHILPDGRVIPCPFWYNERSFGDLHETSFDAIWNSDEYNLLRWELKTGRWRKICRTCPFRALGEIYSGNFEEEVLWGPSK